MSRKKIVIKMPSAGRADAWEPSPEAMARRHAEALGGAFGPSGDAETDRWIRAEDVVPLPDNSSAWSAPPTLGLYAALPRDSTIDLAADRTFIQVLALSFFLPSMLGWFWVANAVKRYRQLFAVSH
jgi:hypothetical protein